MEFAVTLYIFLPSCHSEACCHPVAFLGWFYFLSMQGSRHGNKGKMPLLFWGWQPFNMRDEWSEDEEQLIKHDPDINAPASASFIRRHLIGFPKILKKPTWIGNTFPVSILWNWMVMKSKLNQIVWICCVNCLGKETKMSRILTIHIFLRNKLSPTIGRVVHICGNVFQPIRLHNICSNPIINGAAYNYSNRQR